MESAVVRLGCEEVEVCDHLYNRTELISKLSRP